MNNIALKTAINLNSNTSTVMQQGMIKNNAPFYNNALSPFYKKNQVLEEGEVAINDTLIFNKTTGVLTDSGVSVFTATGEPLRKEIIQDKSIVFYSENFNQQVSIEKEGDVYNLNVTENGTTNTRTLNFQGVTVYNTGAFLDTTSPNRTVYFYAFYEVSGSRNLNFYIYTPSTGLFETKPFNFIRTANYNTVIRYNEDIGLLTIVYGGFIYVADRDFNSFTRLETFQYINEIDLDGSVGTVNPSYPLFDGSLVVGDYNDNENIGKIRIHPRGFITAVTGSTATVDLESTGFYLAKTDNETTGKFTYSGYHARTVFDTGSTNDTTAVYDSGYDETLLAPGFIEIDGEKSSDYYGTRVALNIPNSSLKLLVVISNGFPSALSIVSGAASPAVIEAGVLLTEWLSINADRPISLTRTSISFTDSNGAVNIIRFAENGVFYNSYSYKIASQRFLIVETTGQTNTYDIVDKTQLVTGLDYDGYVKLARSVFRGRDITAIETTEALLGTSINPFLEITRSNQFSLQKNASVVTGFNSEIKDIELINALRQQTYTLPQQTLNIEIFLNTSNQATAAVYAGTLQNQNLNREFIFNDAYEGLTLATQTDGNILLNVSPLSNFINSYSNNDTVNTGSLGAPLIYINNKLYLGYYFLSVFFDLETIFVLQGQAYIATKTMLFITDTANGILINTLPLVDISGYVFLGHNTKEALFFSESERAFFSFYGDRTLTKIADTDSITDIYNTYYNQNTQTIIVHSNRGFIFIREEESFIVAGDITDTILVTETGFIINKDLEADFYSYFEVEGYEQEENDLQTCYMGLDEFTNTRYECWYMKFFSARRLSGTITFSESAITDKNFEGKTKTLTVKESDWDSNNTLYVRYRPSIQNAVAVSIGVKCPFDIYSMAVKMGSSQEPVLSRFNV